MMLFNYNKKVEIIFSNLSSQIFALILIILLIPIFIIIFILIFLFDGKPIFYLSERSGYLGKPFNLYKFRTMKVNDLDDNYRITKLGKFLRRSSSLLYPSFIKLPSFAITGTFDFKAFEIFKNIL